MDGAGTMSLAGVTAEVARVSLQDRNDAARIETGDKKVMFREVMAKFGGEGTPEEKARKAAEEFIAASLVKPLLQQLRESNKAQAPFAPGPYEKQFGPMIDNEIATSMVKSRGWGIVEAVERQLLRASGKVEASV